MSTKDKLLQDGGLGNLYFPTLDEAIATGLIMSGTNIIGNSSGKVVTNSTNWTKVMGTGYIPPGSNGQRSIRSNNANDTSGGTGARSVKITYFDEAVGGPYTETVTLNGTTAVNTVATDIAFVEKMEVASVGSGGANVGAIIIYTQIDGGGSSFGGIASGDNRTLWAHHYISTGRTCLIKQIRANGTAESGVVGIRDHGDPTSDTSVPDNLEFIRFSTGHYSAQFHPSLALEGPRYVSLFVKSDSVADNTVYATLGFLEV